MLTKKQRDLLIFIHSRLQETGISPSFDEMRDALDLRSKSGIHRLVASLEERGFIRRLPNRARALEIIKMPNRGEQNGFMPSLVDNQLGDNQLEHQDRQLIERAKREDMQSINLPVMGRIAAGAPISAIQNHLRDIAVPEHILRSGEHFALEVKGDSMIEAGILDGDLVVIQKTESAMNGDIVVAIIDDREATLKRLRRKGESIALEPANRNYETRIFHPSKVMVQGRLVGLFREY